MTSSPALALEALVTRPDYPRIAAELRALAPTHLVDQADAAAADSAGLMLRLGHLIRGTAAEREFPELPGWLLLAALDAMAGWVTGQAATCRHAPDPYRPAPVLAAAWKPGLIVCPPCGELLLPGRRHSDADRTCDACGTICPAVAAGQPDSGIYPGLVQIGPVIFQYGTCHDCRPPAPVQGAAPRRASGGRRGHRGRGRGRGRRR